MPKLRAKQTVYLTPQGKAALESNDGKNTLLARQDTTIDAHTVKELDLETLLADEAKRRADEAEPKSSMLEQAKARQKAEAEDSKDAKSAPTEPPKTGNSKNEGGSK